jgi:hypothetical protein
MSDASPVVTEPRTTFWTELWGRGLPVHLVAYGLLLLALLAVGPVSSSFTSDEGAYLLQVELLDDGRWDLEYPLADADPDGTFFPIINSDLGDREWFPYVKHPLYVWMLDASIGAFGLDVGSHVWSVVGALGAAAVAWYLARTFDERVARPAFWLAALGPLLANAQMVWAHALSAAVGGVAALVVVWIVGDRRLTAGRVALLAAAGVFGTLLRTEGFPWIAALVAALLVVAVRRRQLRWLPGLGVVAVTSAAAFWLQRTWRLSIVGDTVSSVPDSGSDSIGGWIGERVSAGVAIFVKGAELQPVASQLIVLLLACVVLGGLSWRSGRKPSQAHVLITVALVLYALRLLLFDADPIIGLFAAWPLVLLALVVARRTMFDAAGRVLLVATALFVAVVILSQWGEAGGVQWGGRYLSPALPVVAALSALALQRGLRPTAPEPGRTVARRFPVPLLAGLLLVPALAAAVVPEQLRTLHADLVVDATASGAEVIITSQGALPRFAWDTTDEIDWYLLPSDESLADLLGRLETIGVDEVSTVSIDVDPDDLDGWVVADDRGDVLLLERAPP